VGNIFGTMGAYMTEILKMILSNNAFIQARDRDNAIPGWKMDGGSMD
jgi:hypothetical protein